MKKTIKRIILFLAVLCSVLFAAQIACAASAYVDEVLVSTKDCTSPPASTYLNACSPTTSFSAGQQVWFCIKMVTDVGGGAITGKFSIDGSEKKSNSVPAYPAPKQYQIRCDYYMKFSDAEAGTHVFKGSVSSCSGGACTKQAKFIVNEEELKTFPLYKPKIPKIPKQSFKIPNYIPG